MTNLPVPMYQLQSMEKPEEGVIKGHFYGHELTLVSKNSSKWIERKFEKITLVLKDIEVCGY